MKLAIQPLALLEYKIVHIYRQNINTPKQSQINLDHHWQQEWKFKSEVASDLSLLQLLWLTKHFLMARVTFFVL